MFNTFKSFLLNKIYSFKCEQNIIIESLVYLVFTVWLNWFLNIEQIVLKIFPEYFQKYTLPKKNELKSGWSS